VPKRVRNGGAIKTLYWAVHFGGYLDTKLSGLQVVEKQGTYHILPEKFKIRPDSSLAG
jgi:hypothetical protein